MPVNRYCYFPPVYPLAHFLNNAPPPQGCWCCQIKGKTLYQRIQRTVEKLIKTQHCLTWMFLEGREAGRLAIGMLLYEQIRGNLKAKWQSCWQCHLVLSNSIHCLERGCRLMSFSWIYFLRPLYCYCPTTFHEFGITTASLTPDKEPNKSDLLSVSSLLIFRFFYDLFLNLHVEKYDPERT